MVQVKKEEFNVLRRMWNSILTNFKNLLNNDKNVKIDKDGNILKNVDENTRIFLLILFIGD